LGRPVAVLLLGICNIFMKQTLQGCVAQWWKLFLAITAFCRTGQYHRRVYSRQ